MQMEKNMPRKPFKLTVTHSEKNLLTGTAEQRSALLNHKIIKQELIKAGAGTGKTTALINTLMACVMNYHKEYKRFPRVAVSTFTRKATRELKERMIIKAIELQNAALIQYISYSSRLQISTLHGIFNRFIQTYGYKAGFSPGVTIISERESNRLFVSILQDVLLEKQIGTELLNHYSFEELSLIVKHYILHIQTTIHNSPVNKKEIQSILFDKEAKILRELKENSKKEQKALLELQKEKNYLDMYVHLPNVLEKLGKAVLQMQLQKKKELNQITLNDLEIFTMEILQKERGVLNLREHKWDFWFLDEYQDTSKLQKNILNQLSQNSQMFIVGDPQQSIYYFRGADASIFLKKEQEMRSMKQAQVKYLKKNYRSCPELVAFFNDFFPNEKFEKMETIHNSYKKEKKVAHFIFIKSSQKDREKETSELLETENRINNLLTQGVKPSEIVVLARQNKMLQELAQYLKKQNIPVHLHSSGSFKKRREVTDALLLFHFILNPHHDENLIGLLRTPYCRIPDQILADVIQQKIHTKNRQSLWEFFLQIGSMKKITNEGQKYTTIDMKNPVLNFPTLFKAQSVIQTLNYYFENAKTIGIVNSFQSALENLGFIDLSYYQDSTGVREANFWKFIYCLKDYEAKGVSNLFAFADHLFYDSFKVELDQSDYSQNAVSAVESSGIQLMTVHAAKGLEFKHVILVKVCSSFRHTEGFQYFVGDKETGKWAISVRSEEEDKRIKSSFHKKIQEEQKNTEMEEWDRLLYVALTRAQETVTLIGSGKPGKYSWYNRFPFFFNLKPGNYQKDFYSYCVKDI